MKIDLGSIQERKEGNKIDGWSACICSDPECDLYFFQKSTLLKILNPYLEKWKDLPLNITLRSLKNTTNGFMLISLDIEQMGDIKKEELINCLRDEK